MIGAGIAAIVVGLALLFFMPWVGVPVALVGLALVVAYVAGLGRQAARREEPPA